MALELPRRRIENRQIQIPQRQVPFEQILAVESQNPLAQAISTTGNVIGAVIQKRAEARKLGAELDALEKQANVPAGSYAGLDPEIAASLVKIQMAQKAEGKKIQLGQPFTNKEGKSYQYFYDQKSDEITPRELSMGTPPPKETSPESKIFIGTDANGNPLILGNKSGTISTGIVPSGGSVLPKNQAGVIQKDVKDIDNQLQQLREIRKMLGDVPGGITGGIESLTSKATYGAIGGKAKQYNDLKPSIATKIYRAMTGDTRLSDADAASRAYPLLPSLAEPLELREAKIRNLEKNLADRKSNLMSSGGLKSIISEQDENKERRYQEWKKQNGY